MFEVVEFYETKRDDEKEILQGTLHVRFTIWECTLEIRGIHVSNKKNSWWFGLPYKIAIDPKTGEKIKYPVISFFDREDGKRFFDEIKEKGREFIIEKYGDKNVDSVHKPVDSVHKEIDLVHKELPSAVSKKSSIIEWKDPPAKKNKFVRTGLIGCLNNSGVSSKNYKRVLNEQDRLGATIKNSE